jgi:hypothetical protein
MDFLNQIMDKLKDTSDPTLYYIIGGSIFILFLMFLRKTLYIAIIIAGAIVFYLSVCYSTGYKIDFANLSNFHINDFFSAAGQMIDGWMKGFSGTAK